MTLNLDYYRKQAKALLKSARSGDADALARIARHSHADPSAFALHDAQLAVAREQGFASWPRFRAFIASSALDDPGLVAAFVNAATSDRRRADELLAAHPALATAGFHPALVLGDTAAIERALAEAPELATAPGGPDNDEPLLYVCFSRYANPAGGRADSLVETARLLLRHGANPNASFTPEEYPDNPLSVLYGATGVNNNPALARVLLEAGANPNDNESLYHSTEHRDHVCMKLLLEFGATPARANPVKHILDREDAEGLRILLDAGADPNDPNPAGETGLHWAVWRGRSAAIVAMLLDGGAAIDARRNDGVTAYALAVQTGQAETAALLAARGADTMSASELDRYLAACAAASPAELERLLASPPPVSDFGPERLLADLAMERRVIPLRALLAAGARVDARGQHGGTALHWACWKGYPDVVEILLKSGASLAIQDHDFHAPPAGWFAHGLHNCGERAAANYPAVARLLVSSGAKFAPADLPTGDPEVDAILLPPE